MSCLESVEKRECVWVRLTNLIDGLDAEVSNDFVLSS